MQRGKNEIVGSPGEAYVPQGPIAGDAMHCFEASVLVAVLCVY